MAQWLSAVITTQRVVSSIEKIENLFYTAFNMSGLHP